ncbi:MAG: DUF4846 domain-containing protein [Agathobacter sp.]|nr:DUF4846 domain-containing protein [Agathobacter sp.]
MGKWCKRNRKQKVGTWLVFSMLLISMLAGCRNAEEPKVGGNGIVESDATATEQGIQTKKNETEKQSSYEVNREGTTLQTRFPVPRGYERIDCGEDSFGSFLRSYPLLPDGENVHLYDGSLKGNQEDHAAVFDMDMTEGDLQQCADSVLRLYAEYLYETKQYDRMNFQLTNGFVVSFDKWRTGMRVAVDGNDTSWIASAEASDSQESFESYLQFLFIYAGTVSMGNECRPSELTGIQPGDVFLYSGSPGHVVMVLDVCERKNGERAFLLGQGYMPAQQFHVLKNPAHQDDPWYYADEVSYPFRTAEYTFEEGSLMRPNYLQ